MRISTLLTIVVLAGMAVATAQNSSPRTTTDPPSASTSTLTGCLRGSVNQYYVIDKKGTEHVLLSKGRDLSSYVGHLVTITGEADTNRDASASSDEGTAHGNRLFSVDSVSDQGACRK